jgi:hypothetical protein
MVKGYPTKTDADYKYSDKTEFNGTEKLWQERQYFNNENAKNHNRLLTQTFQDKEDKAPKSMDFKSMYQECIKGSAELKLWGSSSNLTVDDMAVLACRDTGCELNYCQTSLHDPHEWKTFKDCDKQTRAVYKCISSQIRYFNIDPQGTVQEHLKVVLERKRLTKYAYLYDKVDKMKDKKAKNSLEILNPVITWTKLQRKMLLIDEKQILNKYYLKEMEMSSIRESVKNKSIMSMKI